MISDSDVLINVRHERTCRLNSARAFHVTLNYAWYIATCRHGISNGKGSD